MPDTTLFAKPGETFDQYEARVGKPQGNPTPVPTGGIFAGGGQTVQQGNAQYNATTDAAKATGPTNPMTGAPISSGTGASPRYTSGLAAAQANYENPQTRSLADINKEVSDQFQAAITAITGYYNNLTATQTKTNENNSGRARANAAAAGTLGGDFGNMALGAADKENNAALATIEAGKNKEIQDVYNKVSSTARDEYQTELNNANDTAKRRLDVATAQTTEARNNIKSAASQTDLKDMSPDQLQKMFQSSGFSTMEDFTAFYNGSRQSALNANYSAPSQLADGSVVQYYKNPVTGETTVKELVGAKEKPINIPRGGTLVDPVTGKVIAKGQPFVVGGGSGPNGGGTLTTEANNFWAQAAASGVNMNSLIPSLGMGASAVAEKSAILQNIASNAKKLNIDGTTFGAILTDKRAKAKTYAQLQTVGSQTKVNEDNANKNFTQLIGLAQKVDAKKLNTAIPVLDNWIRSGEVYATGDADINNFMGVLTSTLTEYAKVVSGATTGAAVKEGANEQAQKLLNAGLSAATIQSFANTAKQEMGNRTSSYDDALKGLFGDIKNYDDTNTGGLGTTTADAVTKAGIDAGYTAEDVQGLRDQGYSDDQITALFNN